MKIAVIGLGSVLMGDDALGPYVISRLQATYDFTGEVSLIDLGTPGPEFAGYLTEYDNLIVIDTVKAKGKPGELKRYERFELANVVPNPRLSPHDPNLREALLTADFVGKAPEHVVLLGMIPEEVSLRTCLSETVQEALPELEALVLDELRSLGVPVQRKEKPVAPEFWWEEGQE